MKKILSLLVALLISTNAYAGLPEVVRLQANGMSLGLANEVDDIYYSSGDRVSGLVLTNNNFLMGRNAANSADLDVLRVRITNGTQLNTASGTSLQFSLNGSVTWSISSAGALTQDATNGGDIILAKSGTTISVQEATGATACMGLATPNGNTNVTVTTSCGSGGRVFFSRAGAITNMGVITLTASPNGTNFTFASTNAADTTASSVLWWIVKESA